MSAPQILADRSGPDMVTPKPTPYPLPFTRQAIEEDVNITISRVEHEIDKLCVIPPGERNETNTLLKLDAILSYLDKHLLKYQILYGLYSTSDLQSAAIEAAQMRAKTIRTISGRDDLFECIRNTTPVSEYGKWLYQQELTFFRLGGAGVSHEKKMTHENLYKELESLNRRYLTNIRENRPLSQNLQIIEQAASIRNEIALRSGYRTWTDLIADEQGWLMNGSGVSMFLTQISPLVRERFQPVMAEMILKKQMKDPTNTTIYDYEIEGLIGQQSLANTDIRDDLFRLTGDSIISRSLSGISCLMGVVTEQVPDARVYAPDVSLYRISEKATNKTLGWVYFDLHNRPGKSEEWMTAMIESGWDETTVHENIHSSPVYIVSGILQETPNGIQFGDEELTLFFHELGHLYTRILTSSGNSSDEPAILPVELTEASSKFFEYLAWTPEFLSILSTQENCLYFPLREKVTDTRSALHDPDSAYNRWLLARDTTISLLDNRIAQSSEDIRFGEWYSEICANITGTIITDQGGYLLQHPHLSGDSTGTYWIYLSGDLYGAALYTRFQKSGFLNRSVWSEFKNTILTPDNQSRPSNERIRDFTKNDNYLPVQYYETGDKQTIHSDLQYVPECIAHEFT